ncbi:MAG: tetratricopeptide repeat protein [Bacteriovoracia bacterium]
MSEATEIQSLEQTLNRTDLGHTIYENRKLFFGLILAVLIGATGWVLWKQANKSAALDNAEAVFEFQNGTWSEVKSGKKTATDLVSSFEKLPAKVQSAPIMLPVILEMTKFLGDKGQYQEAEAILSKVTGSYNHPVSSFFVRMQRAVVLEKLGKVDEAIAVLEPLAQGKDALVPAKVSVQLGRLYLVKGEKGKAQTQFDYVVNNFPNDEQAKVAKLYLSQISK